MERSKFDKVMNEVFAAFQKQQPRQAVLDVIFDKGMDFPDDFIDWAAAKLKDEEKLPVNLGRELGRMWTAYRAEHESEQQHDPYANECAGDPSCPDCHGTGWHYVWPKDPKWYKPGCAEFAIPCVCNTSVDSWEHPPRKATLEDLRLSGKWTMRRPKPVRNGDPTPLGFSLQQLLDRLHAGQGIEDEPEDPRRQMPEALQ